MKYLAKKLIPILVILCLIVGTMALPVSAAGSSLAFSKTKLTVGETLTVTARFSTSSGNPMYALEAYITYDAKTLQYVESSNCNKITDGKVKMVLTSDGKVSLSQTVKFKAIKAGSAQISIEQVYYVDKNNEEQSLSSDSNVVTIASASAQASSDANLKALSVSAGTLVPAFSPNVTSYNVTIPYTETELLLQATKSDSKATYTVIGNKEMKVGANKRQIVVTAENGNTKTYTINVIRLDQNGNVPEDVGNDTGENKIEVAVGDDIKYISDEISSENVPQGFSIIDYVYEGETVAAVGNDAYVMLYLVNPDGTDAAYYVINDDNSLTRVVKFKIGDSAYYILPAHEVPVGFKAVNNLQLNGVPVEAYKSEDPAYSEFYAVYAAGPQGFIGFYYFDTLDKTLQRAVGLTFGEDVELPTENNKSFLENLFAMNIAEKIVAGTILAIIVLLIVLIIVLIIKIAISGEKKEKKVKKAIEEPVTAEPENAGFEYVSLTEPKNTQNPETEE